MSKFSEVLNDSIEAGKQSSSYRNYLYIRKRVIRIIDEMQLHNNHLPSDYWEEELSGLDYMLDASPLIIRKLREHCHHITGIRAYEYRGHHSHRQNAFAQKLALLRQQDEVGLFVPESPLLGGFGHKIDDAIVNLDTLKFYECLIALQNAGLLNDLLENKNRKKIILEIGAGWGGFPYQLKTLFSNVAYVIIDLPQVLLLSAVYLKTLFPSASVFIYGDKPIENLWNNPKAYDFIFLPHYIVDNFQIDDIYLTINLASFQEMTTAQVDMYVRKAAKLKCPHLYSLNRDRSPHNTQLTTVSSIIGKYYNSKEIKVLDSAYVDLSKSSESKASKNKPFTKHSLAFLRGKKKEKVRKRSTHKYRHLVGTLSIS